MSACAPPVEIRCGGKVQKAVSTVSLHKEPESESAALLVFPMPKQV